ncbi:restriction endonuclease subunit S [Aeromonas hydrophila]|uniref:restriction endonuclease subunit S n=1 Tax=Aeromonas hydrophila TaxID=644 RepID=UPI0039859F9B
MVPECWKVVEIGQCLSLLKSGLSRQLSNDDIGIPVIRSGNMSDQEVDFSDLKFWYIDDPQGANTQSYILDDGDLLINFINSPSQIGKSCLFKNKIGRPCIYTTNILRAKAKIDGQYLFYTTKTKQYNDYIQSITKPAVNQASFTTADFKKYKFPLPPHNEQKKIANILSTWDKAINTTERLLANSQQQKKALMQQLLTGKKRLNGYSGAFKRYHFSDLLKIDSKSLGTKTDPDFEFDYISLSDVELGKIGSVLEHHVYKNAPSRARRIVKAGDILLSTVRPNLQGFAKISNPHENCIASTGFSVLTPKKGTCGDYIYHYLFSAHITGQINSLVVGTNYPAINSSDVSGLCIYCPCYDEQVKIAAILNNSDATIIALQQKLDALKQEKKALMQQLLTGKRRVKVDVAA